MIIEKVTGRRFYDEANRRLLRRLRLTDTIPQDGLRLKGVIQGYAGPNNPFGGRDAMIRGGKFAINPQFEWTGGGYASTAEDLARWAKMMYEGEAFSSDLLPQVLDGVPAPMLGGESRYGLGVIIRKTSLGTSETPKVFANFSPGLALKPWGSKGTFGFFATLKELRRVCGGERRRNPFRVASSIK